MSSPPLRPALLATVALSVTLGGCKIENRPLLARNDPPAAVAAAPALGPLDPAPATSNTPLTEADLTPTQLYAYPVRAQTVSRAFYDAPPTYAFDYGSEQPWVWQADDNMMFAEPYDDGYRYYYYEPGEDYPYFVQDPDYGYAYGPAGALIAVFDAAGAYLSYDRYAAVYDRGRPYWGRGYALDSAFRRSPRERFHDASWAPRAAAISQTRERWFQRASAQPAWRSAVDAPGHFDRGRRNGWHNDRGPQQTARQDPAAFQHRQDARRFDAQGVVAQRGHGAHDQQAQRYAMARESHGPGRDHASRGHGPQDRHGPQREQRQAFARAEMRQGQDRGHGGGRQGARSAESFGQNAGWRGGGQGHGGPHAERSQPQGGGGGHGQGHGGGGGGGHQGGGQGHGNGGGGHGGGHDKHG